MAAHNYVSNESSGVSDRVAAFFVNRDDAYPAVSELKDAASENIGLAVANDYDTTPAGAEPHVRHGCCARA